MKLPYPYVTNAPKYLNYKKSQMTQKVMVSTQKVCHKCEQCETEAILLDTMMQHSDKELEINVSANKQ